MFFSLGSNVVKYESELKVLMLKLEHLLNDSNDYFTLFKHQLEGLADVHLLQLTPCEVKCIPGCDSLI